MLRYIINCLLLLLPPTRLFVIRSFLLRLAGVHLGHNVKFCGHSWIYGRGDLFIGDNTWISHNCRIYTHLSSYVRIGANCDIGPHVKIIVGSHVLGSSIRRAGVEIASPIHIGDGSWIASASLILDGTFIPPGCVVGAGSTVLSRSFQPNSLIVGSPAFSKILF